MEATKNFMHEHKEVMSLFKHNGWSEDKLQKPWVVGISQ